MGNGINAHMSFSMHSEMMAIHSALSASTALASTEAYVKQPNARVSGGANHKNTNAKRSKPRRQEGKGQCRQRAHKMKLRVKKKRFDRAAIGFSLPYVSHL